MSDQVQTGTTSPETTAASGEMLSSDALKRKFRPGEAVVEGALFFSGAVSIFTTLGIVWVLVSESAAFFSQVSLLQFFGTFTWQPRIQEFGIWPLISATLMVATIALLVAIPLGLASAIYLSEYAAPRVRSYLKPILEILAGIPTVVYGYFAFTVVTPFLQGILGRDVVQVFNTMAAGLVVGILLIPMIASLSEDALSAVPRQLREGSYGLGLTKWETATQVVFPSALSGVLAALIVAASRAVGETMVAAMAAGAGPRLTLNPFESAETMTGHIARISGGDLSQFSIDYQSIFAIGMMLFLMTLALNVVSIQIVKRFREVYD